MYIEVTVDLSRYDAEEFDLRLSDFHSIKKMIDIAWQARSISERQREGHWVRVVNKQTAFPGYLTLAECGITTGDRLEIL
ncbi:EsaB/YukD family protein [Sporosarcina sp. FSL W7-1349]|uniref:EsaB/YukD family protein n=1 Tax=Sporosarcina sp. FSL W7-1349 TaxID=2921561 RepID=UPI0030FAA55B